jgi:TRAP-type transport system small permease protein
MQTTTNQHCHRRFALFLSGLVTLLAGVAALAVGVMILLTCADVVGRRLGHPLNGTYELVEVFGAIAMVSALPYTTACKAHVAIDFLPHKLSSRGRMILGTFVALVCIAIYAVLTWGLVQYGFELKANSQGTVTLRWPIFWLPPWMGICTAATVLVLLYQIMRPGRELMQP